MIAWLRPMVWCLLGLNWSVSASVSAIAQDATAYEKACRDCHAAPARIVRKLGGKAESESRANLTELLKRHHAPDPKEREQIIDYLLMLQKEATR